MHSLQYILAYKLTIFGWILTIKLLGSAYTRFMPHRHTLAARGSMVWTISRSLGLHVCVGACVTTQTAAAAAAYQLSQPLLTWHHNKNCHVTHVLTCHSCCELIDTHALSTHRSRVVALPDFRYRLIRELLIFARFSAAGMRVSLSEHEGHLTCVTAYTWVYTVIIVMFLSHLCYRRVSEAVDWYDPVLHAEESVIPGVHLSHGQWSDVPGH